MYTLDSKNSTFSLSLSGLDGLCVVAHSVGGGPYMTYMSRVAGRPCARHCSAAAASLSLPCAWSYTLEEGS